MLHISFSSGIQTFSTWSFQGLFLPENSRSCMGVTGLFFPGTGTYVCLISSMAFFSLENSKVNLSEHFSEDISYFAWEFIFASEYHDLFLSENLEVSFCMEIIGLFLSQNCKAFVFPENNFCLRNYGTFFLPPFCLRIITLLYFFFLMRTVRLICLRMVCWFYWSFRGIVFFFPCFEKWYLFFAKEKRICNYAIPRKKNHY